MNPSNQIKVLGLIALCLIASLFFAHDGLYTMFALVSLLVIALIMMFTPKQNRQWSPA